MSMELFRQRMYGAKAAATSALTLLHPVARDLSAPMTGDDGDGGDAGLSQPGSPDRGVSPIASSNTMGSRNSPGETSVAGNTRQKDLLLEMVREVEFFHTPDKQAYGRVRVRDHYEVYNLQSEYFRDWLAGLYYRSQRDSIGSIVLNEVISLLRAKARFDGAEREVHLRLAQQGDAIYLDLCNEAWEVIEITKHGWTLCSDSPVCFRREEGKLPLPRPERGGSLLELCPLLNIPNEQQYIPTIAWLLGSLQPQGPFPLLLLGGEQGSCKSTATRMLKLLVDPENPQSSSLPISERDLMIDAENTWVLAFDNISGVKDAMADALCRLATGGGFKTRKLTTDLNQIRITAKRPMIVNGIDTFSRRNDLAERSLYVELYKPGGGCRRSEAELWRAFSEARPRILGALLDAVSAALGNMGNVQLVDTPRMADFAHWVVAAEPTLPWEPGRFMDLYSVMRKQRDQLALELDPLALAVAQLMDSREEWSGSASGLLRELDRFVSGRTAQSEGWPRTPQRLSELLKRTAPVLRAAGLEVETGLRSGHGGARKLRITRVATSDTVVTTAAPSFEAATSDSDCPHPAFEDFGT